MRYWRLFICFVIAMYDATGNAQTISLASLLKEMSDPDTLARYPFPLYASLQASSYNRESVVKDGPGWFADSDGTGFIRMEEKYGKKEWVVMEHEGPGAITKMWAPYFYYNGLDDLEGPIINIYFDGEDSPTISENYFRLITGRGSTPPPFARVTARAGNSYLPIPFAKSCKVTFSSKPFYYIINYRSYSQAVEVKTFSHLQLIQALPLMDEVALKLQAVYPRLKGKRVENTGKIDAGKSLKLTMNTTGAINSLEIMINPEEIKQHPELLRQVVLVAEFDGDQTVWVPLGDFFGSANALNPFQTATRTVRANGQMICSWLMPFQSNAVMYLKNLGNLPIQINRFAATVIGYIWDKRSMHFHANWRSDDVQPGNVFRDWNFIDIKGKGVLIGDAWTVLNPDDGWWGEGDEKIYVDEAWDKKFPTHFGTGTEDYYGWAGGENPSKDDKFSHPFLSNIEVGSATSRRRDVRGFNISTRIRALDAIPFSNRLVFDMEASPGTQIRNPWNFLGYSAVMFWYALPGAVSNRPPLPREALKPIMSLKQLDSMTEEINKPR